MLKVVVVSVNVDGGLLLLVVFSHRSASYVSVEEMGISRTLDGNTGWKVTAACQWRGWVGVGGDPASHPNLDPCPSPSSGYPLTLTHILVCLLQSNPFAATVSLQTTPSFSVHSVMTHCAPEAKPACVRALTGLVRALRGRLKALRRLLLLAGRDGSPQRPSFDAGGSGLLNRKNRGTVLGCCGPAHPSMTVSSPECVCVCVCILLVSVY